MAVYISMGLPAPASRNLSSKKCHRHSKGSWFEILGTRRRSPQVSEPGWSWVFLGSGLEPASNTRWPYHCSPSPPATPYPYSGIAQSS